MYNYMMFLKSHHDGLQGSYMHDVISCFMVFLTYDYKMHNTEAWKKQTHCHADFDLMDNGFVKKC